MKKLTVKRIDREDVSFRLGSTKEVPWGVNYYNDYYLSACLEGPNLPFKVTFYLARDGQVYVQDIGWTAVWRGMDGWNEHSAQIQNIHLKFASPRPSITPGMAEVIREWHINPASRPFPGMAGPGAELLALAGIDGEPNPLIEETGTPIIVDEDGIEFPLINEKYPAQWWKSPLGKDVVIEAWIHNHATHLFGHVVNEQVEWFASMAGESTSTNGEGRSVIKVRGVETMRQPLPEEVRGILTLVSQLEADLDPATTRWVIDAVEPSVLYEGPNRGLADLGTQGFTGFSKAASNQEALIKRAFQGNSTAAYGRYGPYVVCLAVIDGHWEFIAKTTDAQRGGVIIHVGEEQIRRFLIAQEGKFPLKVLSHMDEVGKYLVQQQ